MEYRKLFIKKPQICVPKPFLLNIFRLLAGIPPPLLFLKAKAFNNNSFYILKLFIKSKNLIIPKTAGLIIL